MVDMEYTKRNAILFSFVAGLWFGVWGTVFATGTQLLTVQNVVAATFFFIGIGAVILILTVGW